MKNKCTGCNKKGRWLEYAKCYSCYDCTPKGEKQSYYLKEHKL